MEPEVNTNKKKRKSEEVEDSELNHKSLVEKNLKLTENNDKEIIPVKTEVKKKKKKSPQEKEDLAFETNWFSSILEPLMLNMIALPISLMKAIPEFSSILDNIDDIEFKQASEIKQIEERSHKKKN